MLAQTHKDTEDKMKKRLMALEEDLAKQRAGRASPNLLDGVMVSYYGTPTPLTKVASVVVESGLMLLVKPWEKTLIPAIEKAILTAGLGLNPAASGEVVRVPLPALTEDRRKELIKVVRQEAEATRVHVRNIRREAMNKARDLLKDKAITEDEERSFEEKTQKLTDQTIKQVDTILAAKEKDLMAI